MKTSTDYQSDNELIDEILAGRKEKYRLIVERYSPMIFHIVRKFEKNENQVKELGQQIFVKTYEKLNSFSGKSAFSSWLYSIAKYHCMDYAKNIRRENRRFSEFDYDFEERITASDELPDSGLEAVEMRNKLNFALDKISNDYSEPLLLKYRDGMSYEDISEKLGVSVSALKVRVHRARKELKYWIDN